MKFDADKIDLALAGVVLLDDRLAEIERRQTHRSDDFNGAKHPRGPDGKFVSGSGSAHVAAAVNDYESSLKGKKGNKGGLIQYMLKAKSYTKDEIFEAASEAYGLQPEHKSHINWYLQDLKKKGADVGVATESQAPVKAVEIDTLLPEGATPMMELLKIDFDQAPPEQFLKDYGSVSYSTESSNEYLTKLVEATKAKLGQAPTKVESKFKPEVAKTAEIDTSLPENATMLMEMLKEDFDQAPPEQFLKSYENVNYTAESNNEHLNKTGEATNEYLAKLVEATKAKFGQAPAKLEPEVAKAAELTDEQKNTAAAVAKMDPHKAVEMLNNVLATSSPDFKGKEFLEGLKAEAESKIAAQEPGKEPELTAIQKETAKQVVAMDPAEAIEKIDQALANPGHGTADKAFLQKLKGDIESKVAGPKKDVTEHLAKVEELSKEAQDFNPNGISSKKLAALEQALKSEDPAKGLESIVPINNPASPLQEKVNAAIAAAKAAHPVAKAEESENDTKDFDTMNAIASGNTPLNQKIINLNTFKNHQGTSPKVKAQAIALQDKLQAEAVEADKQAALAAGPKAETPAPPMGGLDIYKKVAIKKILAKAEGLKNAKVKNKAFMISKALEHSTLEQQAKALHGISDWSSDQSATMKALLDNFKVIKTSYAKHLPENGGGTLPASTAQQPKAPEPVKPTPAAHGHKLSEAAKASYASNKAGWANALPANQPTLNEADAGLQAALAHPSAEAQLAAVKALSSIPNPTGQAQKSFNEHLAKVKADYGISVPQTTSSLPSGPSADIQQAIYQVAKGVTPKKIKSWQEYHDSKDNPVGANLHVDTSRVPGDYYAKVTSAYGDNSEDAMTQAVDVAMTHYANDTYPKLESNERDALTSYQGSGSTSINNLLLKGGSNAKTKAIDAALKKSFIPADTPLYRGLRCSLKDLTGFDDPGKSVGRCFEHKNFASASRSLDTAKAFAGYYHGNNSADHVLLKFTMPAGTNGIVMPKQDWEREIVLDRNIMFKVDKVEQNPVGGGKAKHIIHCTYLGKRDDS